MGRRRPRLKLRPIGRDGHGRLIGFSNRLVVLFRWARMFLTHGRSTRLITGSELLPPIAAPEPPVMAPFAPDGDGPADG